MNNINANLSETLERCFRDRLAHQIPYSNLLWVIFYDTFTEHLTNMRSGNLNYHEQH